jgi:hypothetical protein
VPDPALRRSVEFHDSTISAIAREGTATRISLDAYVHRWDRVDGTWKGTGWTQPVQILLVEAANKRLPEPPVDLAGAEVRIGQLAHKDLLPLPFCSSGPATLRLELVTGEVLDLNGRNLIIEPIGEGRYVEDLPDDFRPSDLG